MVTLIKLTRSKHDVSMLLSGLIEYTLNVTHVVDTCVYVCGVCVYVCVCVCLGTVFL